MLFTPEGPRLALFYHLIRTRVYPDLSQRLGMRIGGENRLEWIEARHWERIAESVGIKPWPWIPGGSWTGRQLKNISG